MKTHVAIWIYGAVQGVFFRHSAKRMAEEMGITGFVRNESDGSVYIEAEGERESLDKLLAWCRKGPSYAKVERVDFEFSDDLHGFTAFELK